MQSASRIGRSDVVGETSPPPQMMVVFSPRKGLAEESGGLRGRRFGGTDEERSSRLPRRIASTMC